MLYSMTGHGQSSRKAGQFTIDVEVRTVNNRYLKILARAPELPPAFEGEIESLVREHLKRGSVSVSVKLGNCAGGATSTISRDTLRTYLQEAKSLAAECGISHQVELGSFLQLPGVLDTRGSVDDPDVHEAVRQGLRAALKDLQIMRQAEGQSMAQKLKESLSEIGECISAISKRAPMVLSDYQARLEQKVRLAVEEKGLDLSSADLVREIVLFSDKSDISEEITRLESHLKQFSTLFDQNGSQGRRLDFLLQEMGRETNTIGSKANDSEISKHVVSIKVIIEQIRELVQNIE
ncbi:YicC/YloC family endoribonuclease [Pirellulaceae bacterium SH449]